MAAAAEAALCLPTLSLPILLAGCSYYFCLPRAEIAAGAGPFPPFSPNNPVNHTKGPHSCLHPPPFFSTNAESEPPHLSDGRHTQEQRPSQTERAHAGLARWLRDEGSREKREKEHGAQVPVVLSHLPQFFPRAHATSPPLSPLPCSTPVSRAAAAAASRDKPRHPFPPVHRLTRLFKIRRGTSERRTRCDSPENTACAHGWICPGAVVVSWLAGRQAGLAAGLAAGVVVITFARRRRRLAGWLLAGWLQGRPTRMWADGYTTRLHGIATPTLRRADAARPPPLPAGRPAGGARLLSKSRALPFFSLILRIHCCRSGRLAACWLFVFLARRSPPRCWCGHATGAGQRVQRRSAIHAPHAGNFQPAAEHGMDGWMSGEVALSLCVCVCVCASINQGSISSCRERRVFGLARAARLCVPPVSTQLKAELVGRPAAQMRTRPTGLDGASWWPAVSKAGQYGTRGRGKEPETIRIRGKNPFGCPPSFGQKCRRRASVPLLLLLLLPVRRLGSIVLRLRPRTRRSSSHEAAPPPVCLASSPLLHGGGGKRSGHSINYSVQRAICSSVRSAKRGGGSRS